MSERTWGEIEIEIREDYLRADGPESVEFRQVQWDVWLAEYTRVKQAEAWERNSEETEVGGSCSCCGITEVHRPQNPYRKGESDDQPA